MDRAQINKVVSHVATSYVCRELDRVWFDQFVAAPLGQKLKGLSNSDLRIFKRIAYIFSACFVHREPNPSVQRAFLNMILSDIPPELTKRMMAKDSIPSSRAALLFLENVVDCELMTLSERPQGSKQASPKPSAALKFREKIETSCMAIRENRK